MHTARATIYSVASPNHRYVHDVLCVVVTQLENLVAKNYYLHKSAREAYRSYMQGYAQHTLKQVFNVHSLDILAVAKSFGFDAPPKVQLKISLKNLKNIDQRRNKHGFDEDNPYGNAESAPAAAGGDDDNMNQYVEKGAEAQRRAVSGNQKKQQSRQWSR